MDDQDFRYCKLCLATDVKMFGMTIPAILEAYSQLVQIVVCETVQLYICYECVSLLHKYEEFRSKCITALNVLSSINMDHSKITREVVQSIDRKFYNLDSQLQRTSMLVCNSNDEYVLENNDFKDDETLLKHINSDLVIKQDSHKIEFENKATIHNISFPNKTILESNEYILDNNYNESDHDNYDSKTKEKHLKKGEENTSTSNTVTQEHKLSLSDIVLISDDENYGSVINAYDSKTIKKQISVPKLKKRKKNSSNSDIDSQDQKTSFTNEIVFVTSDYLSKDNDYVPEVKKKEVSLSKLKKKKENITKLSNGSKEQNTSVCDEIVSNGKDHVPEIKKKLVTGTKFKKRKKTTKSVGPINLFEKFKLFDKDYVTVALLTPDDSKKAVLLRKESTNYRNNPYKCDICYKGYGNKLPFDNHMRRHGPEFGSLVCEYCHVRFTTKKCLNKHNVGCHLYKFSCVICQYVCYSYTQAVGHMNIHKGKTYQCNECGLNFSLACSLYSHKNVMHPAEYTCKFCGNMFSSERGMLLHKSLVHRQVSNEITGPKCEECDVQFATETAFKRHLVLSSKHTVRNGCKRCGKSFNDEEDLKTHYKVHTRTLNRYRKLPAACKICGTWLKNQSEYQSHMMLQHPKSESLICEVCGKVFLNTSTLDIHKIIHSNERPYKCRECGKTFKSRNIFNLHENMHTRMRVFQCDLCQKEYTRKGELVKHIRTHFGIRPYKCTFCDKSFPFPCELRSHKNYVHFKKPWPKRDRTKRRA